MSDFLNKLGKFSGRLAKEIGNAMLDSMESTAYNYSRDKRFSEEQRSQYRDFGNGINNMRNGNFNFGSSDDDDY